MKLKLWIADEPEPSLIRTSLSWAEGELTCIRGRYSGMLGTTGSFQWSPAVKSVTALIMLFKSASLQAGRRFEAHLIGGRSSAAASLDYAVSKEPTWLLEMFGVDSKGNCTAKRMFRRLNPNQKRPGPVVVYINENMLRAEDVAVYGTADIPLSAEQLDQYARAVLNSFTSEKEPSESSLITDSPIAA